MTFSNISKALDQRLASMTGGYSIAWENVAFTPGSSIFLSQNILPANTNPFTLGYSSDHKGIYQITVNAPKASGKSGIYTAVQTILAHFTKGLKLTESSQVITVQSVSVSPFRQDDAWTMVSVSVYYRSLA